MHQTIEAVIAKGGQIKILENMSLPVGKRVLITILDEVPVVSEFIHSKTSKHKRQFGQHLGEIKIAPDFDEPLSDEFWLGSSDK